MNDDSNLVVQATVDRIESDLIKNNSKTGVGKNAKKADVLIGKLGDTITKLKTNEAKVQYELARKQYKKTRLTLAIL